MSELRWLRTELMKPFHRWQEDEEGNSKEYCIQFLRAIRSDGQMFVVWDQVGPKTTPEILRSRLDAMLDSPPLEPRFDEETGTWTNSLVPLDYGKGRSGWVEEPKP